MKTSNILISIAIVVLFVYITLSILEGKSKVEAQIDESDDSKEFVFSDKITKDLGEIKVLKLTNSAFVKANGEAQNKITFYEGTGADENFEMHNDTLIIGGKDIEYSLEFNNLAEIILTDNSVLQLNGLKSDSLKVFVFNNARGQLNKVRLSKLGLYTNDNSFIAFNQSITKDVYLQAEENSTVELYSKMDKISGATTENTQVVMTKVKSINLQAEGGLAMH